MKRYCLIACSASKASVACAARHLYTGDLFRKSLRWAESSAPFSGIKVLSARHGLVDIDEVIAPYDTALQNFGAEQRRQWAAGVAGQLLHLVRGDSAEVVALAGRHYTDELSVHLQVAARGVTFIRPMAGLGIGEQKAWLVRELAALA